MADEKPQQAHLKDGVKITTLAYSLRLVFHPEMRLETKKGHDFAKTLTEIFVPTQTNFKSDAWEFVLPQGSTPSCFLSVTVEPSGLQFLVSQPEFNREWYETKFTMLLRRFREFFKPALILQSSAMVNGVLPVEGDARDFIAHNVANMNSTRVAPFGRPIMLIGLRFFFPPYMIKKKEEKPKGKSKKQAPDTVVDWQVNVRIESLLEDPKKLFLQADADWVKPAKWDETAERRVLEQLNTVAEYLDKNVVAFLRHAPNEKEES